MSHARCGQCLVKNAVTGRLPSFSWETGVELLTLMDLEKMMDERGFEPPGLLIANKEAM